MKHLILAAALILSASPAFAAPSHHHNNNDNNNNNNHHGQAPAPVLGLGLPFLLAAGGAAGGLALRLRKNRA